MNKYYEIAKRWQFYLLLIIFTGLGLAPNPGEVFRNSNDLLLHFSGYIAAGISMGLALPVWRHWQRFVFLLGYSLTIEIIQELVPNRSFDWLDLVANGAGVIVGLCIYQWVARPLDRAVCKFIAPS